VAIPYALDPTTAYSAAAEMSWAGVQVKEVWLSPRRSMKGKE